MEGIELMSLRALWFIVAGFVLGFTVSTLWEWLYYRQRRQQIAPRTWGSNAPAGSVSFRESTRSEEAFDNPQRRSPTYRSAGVLLESEKLVSETTSPADERKIRREEQPLRPAQQAADHRSTDRIRPEEEAEPITVATLTGQRWIGKPSTAKETAPSLPPVEAKTTSAFSSTSAQRSTQDTQESLGNPSAIARAGALAAASLSGSTAGLRTAASASHAASAEDPVGTSGIEERDSQDSSVIPKAPAKQGEESEPTEARVKQPVENELSEQPTRVVATHGVAQQSPHTRPAEHISVSETNDNPGQASSSQPASSVTIKPAPAPLHNRPTDYPDDLAMIKGIGEAYKRRLYATGIYTWRQLAETDTDSLRRITRAKPNADIGSWLTQALALGEKYNRMEANFVGPLDDFTRIEGIGAITADILYKAGLCTYEQLASASPDDLARIVPAPTVGNENDFDGWVSDAARLAGAKRRNNGMLP